MSHRSADPAPEPPRPRPLLRGADPVSMPGMRPRAWIHLVFSLLVVAIPAAASPVTWYAGGDVALATRHVWRGVLREGSWSIQPDLYVTIGRETVPVGPGILRDFDLTVGVWGDADLTGWDWSELNPWVQLGATAGPIDLAVGYTAYIYDGQQPPPVPRTGDDDTSEIFWRVTGGPERLAVSLAGWTDVRRVKGTYVETGISFQVPLNPFPAPGVADPVFTTFQLGLLAGWSAGQNISADQNANFSGDGLTHIQMSASTSALWKGVLSIEPEIRLQVNGDRFTGIAGDGPQSDNKTVGWFILSITPVKLFGSRVR